MRSTKTTTRGHKLCSFCRKNTRRPNQRTCRECHAKWMKEYRHRAAEAQA